jgi:hypothetical protein
VQPDAIGERAPYRLPRRARAEHLAASQPDESAQTRFRAVSVVERALDLRIDPVRRGGPEDLEHGVALSKREASPEAPGSRDRELVNDRGTNM